MSFNLKEALKFNKATVGLAAAGLAYVNSLVGGDHSASQMPFVLKVAGTACLVLFVSSVLYGVLVMGRVTRLADDKESIDDELMRKWGLRHISTLLVGACLGVAR
jgi:hypothetical protein